MFNTTLMPITLDSKTRQDQPLSPQ